MTIDQMSFQTSATNDLDGSRNMTYNVSAASFNYCCYQATTVPLSLRFRRLLKTIHNIETLYSVKLKATTIQKLIRRFYKWSKNNHVP